MVGPNCHLVSQQCTHNTIFTATVVFLGFQMDLKSTYSSRWKAEEEEGKCSNSIIINQVECSIEMNQETREKCRQLLGKKREEGLRRAERSQWRQKRGQRQSISVPIVSGSINHQLLTVSQSLKKAKSLRNQINFHLTIKMTRQFSSAKNRGCKIHFIKQITFRILVSERSLEFHQSSRVTPGCRSTFSRVLTFLRLPVSLSWRE